MSEKTYEIFFGSGAPRTLQNEYVKLVINKSGGMMKLSHI